MKSYQLGKRPTDSLKALVNTLVPPISKEDLARAEDQEFPIVSSNEKLQGYWSYDLTSADCKFMEVLITTIQTKLGDFQRIQFIILLYLLSSAIGTFLIFFSFRLIFQPFTSWSLEDRIRGLQNLRDSDILIKRNIFSGIKRLLCGLAYTFSDQDEDFRNPQDLNPFWKYINYPGPMYRSLSKKEDAARVQTSGHSFLFHNGKRNENIFITPKEAQQKDIDVIIIGSGAGGSVAALNLTKIGLTVLVLEKGPYTPPEFISNLEADAMDKYYENHGLLTTNDGNITLLAGSTLGGATTINWGCCIDTPDFVLEEWAQKYGLVQFQKKIDSSQMSEFDVSLQAIKDRLGVRSDEFIKDVFKRNDRAVKDGNEPPNNIANTHLYTGCKSLNYKVEGTGCNLKKPEQDSAGYTCFSDRDGNKQSSVITFLKDASSTGKLFIMDDCHVERILTLSCKESKKGKKAIGVSVRIKDGDSFQIKVKRHVILSAGSINTPCVLLRSGFKNKHIGKHLHLHPVCATVGVFREKTETKQFKRTDGTISSFLKAPMTVVCKEFEHIHNNYGPKIEVPSSHTGLAAAGTHWINPYDFKNKMLEISNTVPLIILQRDQSEGTISIGLDRKPSISYEINEEDEESMMTGILGTLEILLAADSDYIFTGHNNDVGLNAKDVQMESKDIMDRIKHEKVIHYMQKVKDRGLGKHRIGMFSAHQMGSCRMGISSEVSSVDENGELWECDDVFVLDASIFPSASGANPMMTVYALSHMLSSRLARKNNP
jgi:choline dehydrogenase-like flavoprotein